MYLKETDRDFMAKILKYNKPSDTNTFLVGENMHPNKIVFIDSVVKR